MLVALFLIGFSLVIYYKADYDRLYSFYEQLEIRALTAAVMVLEKDELPSVDIKRAEDKMKIKLTNEFIYIVDTNYTVIFSSEESDFDVARENVDAALEAVRVKELQKDTQHLFLRYWDDGQDFVIVAQAYDRIGFDYLADLRFILVLGCLLAPVLIFITGWWFTANMFKPVKEITMFAARISERNLHQRIIENKNNDELTVLARTFNKMLERIDSAFKREKDLISYASHELRTPITAMKGSIEVLLSQSRDSQEYISTLQSIYEDIGILSDTTDKLLSLAKAGHHLNNIDYKDIIIDELISAATEELLERYPGRVVNFHFDDISENNLYIKGSQSLLKSAVLNVLDNALKYSPDDKPVDVFLRAKSDTFVLEVRDYGYGIEPDEMENVFLPFYRSSRTKDITGHGIGLALTEAVIKSHGGEIEIDSQPAKGTTVRIKLVI